MHQLRSAELAFGPAAVAPFLAPVFEACELATAIWRRHGLQACKQADGSLPELVRQLDMPWLANRMVQSVKVSD